MPVVGQQLVARNIIKFGKGFTDNVNKSMDSVRNILDQQVTINMSLQDHSLAELKKLGSPYSSRYGSQGAGLHTPYYQVHSQSGNLLSSKSSGVIPASVDDGTLKASAFVKLDKDIAEYALFVVYGTSKMIPRPFLEGSKNEVKGAVLSLLQGKLKNLNFNFEK